MSKLVINKYSVDKKELSVIFTFLCWLIVGFIIIFMGINNVFAASYNADNFTAQLYDNLGPTLNPVNTIKEEDGSLFYYGFIGLTAYSSGGAWGVSSPIPLIANHTYSMTVDPYAPGCGYTILSTYPRLGVGSSLANAKTSYQNNTNVDEKFYQAISNSNYLQYVFTPTINASYIVFPYATTSSCNSTTNQLSNIVIEDLGESGISQDQINTSLNNQTNTLNNSIQNSTDTITGEIDDMEQNIIDSNKETQDVIKDQFNDCKDSSNLLPNTATTQTINGVTFTINNDGSVLVNGTATARANLRLFSNRIILSPDLYTLDTFKNSGKSFLQLTITKDDNSTIYPGSQNNKTTIDLTNGEAYLLSAFISVNAGDTANNELIKPMLYKGTDYKSYEKYGEEICSNRIDETNDKLNDLNSSLNDSNVDGSLGDAGSFFDNFTTTDHGGLSGIITAPLVAINQMLNTSCNPMTTTFKGKELSLPCGYEFWNKMGPIQDFVNLVLGGLLCYQIIIKLYKLIEKIKNPEDDRLEVMDL